MDVHGREHRNPRRKQETPTRPLETSGNKMELHMTFLPKSAEARQELVTLLIAIPLSLAGTSFLFFLLDASARAAAI